MNDEIASLPLRKNLPASQLNAGCFQIQILPDFRCLLRPETHDWELEFPTTKEAFDYAESLPGGEDAKMTVLDGQGVRFAKVVLR